MNSVDLPGKGLGRFFFFSFFFPFFFCWEQGRDSVMLLFSAGYELSEFSGKWAWPLFFFFHFLKTCEQGMNLVFLFIETCQQGTDSVVFSPTRVGTR